MPWVISICWKGLSKYVYFSLPFKSFIVMVNGNFLPVGSFLIIIGLMIIVVRIIISIALVGLILFCRKAVRKMASFSMYSYRIVSLIGLMIFLSGCLVLELMRIVGNIRYYDDINPDFLMDFFTGFTTAITSLIYIAFIPAVLFSIFLLIANIVLFFKEGRSLHNMFGVVLGTFLVLGSLGIINLYLMLDQIMNVHSYFGFHFSLAVENIFAIVVVYFECMMLATIYVSYKAMHHKVSYNKSYIIVLGCHVREDGLPGGVLRKRVEAAIKFANEQKKNNGKLPILIFSGGKGNDEPISEAESMKKYIIAQKYDGEILVEDKSTTTFENFKFSKKLIKDTQNIAFATTDFHIFRSAVFASEIGYHKIEGIGAKSPWYFYYNALIREFLANLSAEHKMHAFNIFLICAIMIILIVISYLFDIM